MELSPSAISQRTFTSTRRGYDQTEVDGFLRDVAAAFGEMVLRPCHLVNAQFSLPFCAPGSFDKMWSDIVNALQPGGYFVGTFFGVNDDWAESPRMTFHTAEQIAAMLTAFDIELMKEIEEDGSTAVGGAKHWHLSGHVPRTAI